MNSASNPTLTARCYRVVFDELKAVAVRLGANDRHIQDVINFVEEWLDRGAQNCEKIEEFYRLYNFAKFGPSVAGGPKNVCNLPSHKVECLDGLYWLYDGDVNQAIEKVEAMHALAAQPPTPPKEAN